MNLVQKTFVGAAGVLLLIAFIISLLSPSAAYPVTRAGGSTEIFTTTCISPWKHWTGNHSSVSNFSNIVPMTQSGGPAINTYYFDIEEGVCATAITGREHWSDVLVILALLSGGGAVVTFRRRSERRAQPL